MGQIHVEQKGHAATIQVLGDFVFDINREFRDAYQKLPRDTFFTIDLSRSGYMDSAGLGMLIQLRDYAGSDDARIRISGANETIRNVFDVTNFERLFEID